MNSKELTVIIANYNNEKYIGKCLESIIGQTYQYLDIIVIDDGSCDDSLRIIREYQNKDERIRVIAKNREGAASARAVGVQHARGAYLTFPDSDDWLDPSAYSVMMERAIENDVDIVCNNSCYREDHGKTEIIGRLFDEGRYTEDELNRLRDNIFLIAPSLWLKIFKAGCIEQYVMAVDYGTKVSNDMAASYPAIMNAKSIYMMNMAMYHYRINHKSPSNLGPAVKINSYALTYLRLADVFWGNENLLVRLDDHMGKIINQLLKSLLSVSEIKRVRRYKAVEGMSDIYGNGKPAIRVKLFFKKKYFSLFLVNWVMPYWRES